MLRLLDNSEEIIKFYGSFETENDFIFLLELAEGGDLYHKLK
jgi:hypothetical protein